MAAKTPALRALDRAAVTYKVHTYDLKASELSYGEAVADALGISPRQMFKTLVAICDGSPVIAVVPVSGHLSLKALARAADGKKVSLADPADAERLTGYVVGGISPFGQKRDMAVYIDQTATGFETIFVSAGRRGLQVELAPTDLIRLLEANAVALRD